MEDFLGTELVVGDKVILVEPRYRNFVHGTIHKMTKFYCFINYINSNGYPQEVKQYGEQLIKLRSPK